VMCRKVRFLPDVGLMLRDAGGADVTVSSAVPLTDPSVAVTVAAPVPLPVAFPLEPELLETVAVEVDDDDQATELVKLAVERSE
jgi:hypothetical protein